MTNSQPQSNKPSAKFLQTLKEMSKERGVTYVPPTTTAEARSQYRALKSVPRLDPIDRRMEDKAIRDEVATGTYGLSFREDEIGGYGSTAHWSARG